MQSLAPVRGAERSAFAMLDKCTMKGCGKPVAYHVALAVPSDVAEPGGAMDHAALTDAAVFPACADHVDHVAKVFYGAAYALEGTVTASSSEGR
jgi:hypothetical protein